MEYLLTINITANNVAYLTYLLNELIWASIL